MARMTDSLGRPNTGIMHGPVVGIVTDNDDPDQLGRIKVKFPTLDGEPGSFWLRQISPNAGKERGLYALPEVDDEVLVMFMQGSQDVGVIMGQFWNGPDVPPPEAIGGMPGSGKSDTGAERSTDLFTDGSTDDAANDRRFWRSRAGSLLVFDDTGGAETIQIWDHTHTLGLIFDPNEQRIILCNSGGDLHIRTKNDLYLEAGNDIIITAKNDMDTLVHNDMITHVDMNIRVDSGKDSIWTAGMNFTQEAGQAWSASAGTDASLEGAINTTVKAGAMGTFDGGATAVVKGGVVTIN